MLTDSENNMMIKSFSLRLIEGRRFLLLLLLFVNGQIIQAVCKPTDVSYLKKETQTTIFVSNGTLVTGMEKLHIPKPQKERTDRKSKKNNSAASHKRKHAKKQNTLQEVRSLPKTVQIFSRNTKSEKSFLMGSDSNKQIVRPAQQTIEFLLPRFEDKILSLIFLLGLFLKNIYKNLCFFDLNLFKNFKRPPPSLFQQTN